jgi:dephospho-CoA kinase
MGHQILDSNVEVLTELEKGFGTDIFIGSREDDSDLQRANFGAGKRIVDRKTLGKVVFADAKSIETLNKIMWPNIAELQNIVLSQFEQSNKTNIAAIEGALIIEAGYQKYYHEIWVAQLPKEQAKKRLLSRNPELSEEEAQRRLDTQIDDEERIKHASFV